MTLRTRLKVALALVAIVLGLVVLFVPRAVEQAQLEQVDNQLQAALPIARGQMDLLAPPGGPILAPRAESASFSDIYIAAAAPDGTRTIVVESRNAADREPAAPSSLSTPGDLQFETVDTLGHGSGSWRAIAVPVESTDGRLVLAIPLDQVQATTNDVRWALAAGGLAVFAMLLLAGWWVLRLGLRPIAEVTDVAEAIAAGERNRRASEGHGRTEAAHLARAVNTMLDQRISAEDRLRQFVADASHELRTPVAAILGFTDLYRTGALADEDSMDQAMRRIGQESRRMGDLVEDLLLLAGLDQGRPLDLVPVDLGALLDDVVLDASATHPSRDVVLDAEPGLTVNGDDARLRQVFANLLGNALKYGGHEASVRITARRLDDVCAVEVADDGVGMDADAVSHAFDRFWRADTARVRSQTGAGLGLSIVRAIVEAHHGMIAIDSAPSAGTRVRVALFCDPTSPGNPQGVERALA